MHVCQIVSNNIYTNLTSERERKKKLERPEKEKISKTDVRLEVCRSTVRSTLTVRQMERHFDDAR